jgi:hypothetical protein
MLYIYMTIKTNKVMELTGTQIAKATKMINDTKVEIAKAIEKGKAHRYQEDIEKMEAIESMEFVDADLLVHNFYSKLPSKGLTTWTKLFSTPANKL